MITVILCAILIDLSFFFMLKAIFLAKKCCCKDFIANFVHITDAAASVGMIFFI